MDFQERINLIINEYFHNDLQLFSRRTGMPAERLLQLLRSGNAWTEEDWRSLLWVTGIRKDWLLQGEGNMLDEVGEGMPSMHPLADSFCQCKHADPKSESVHIPVLYSFRHKVREGWISIGQPFRGIGLIGIPSTDGMFPPVDAYLRSVAAKGWGVCFCAGRLRSYASRARGVFGAAKAAGYLPADAAFRLFDFGDLPCSGRANPLDSVRLNDSSSAVILARNLYAALQLAGGAGGHEAVERGFDVMAGLSVKLLTAAVYLFVNHCVVPFDERGRELHLRPGCDSVYLGPDGHESVPVRWRGRYADLPHVLDFLLGDFGSMLQILKACPQSALFLAPYWMPETDSGSACSQLDESTRFLRERIRQVFTPEACWLLSGADIPLRRNASAAPEWLFITPPREGDDASAVFSNLLFNSMLEASNVSAADNVPVAFLSEDVVRSPVYSLEELFSTASRARLSLLLGIPSREGFRSVYGNDEADVFFRCMGHLACTGFCDRDTAQWLTDDPKAVGRVRTTRQGQHPEVSVAAPLRVRHMPPGWVAGRTTRLCAGGAGVSSSPFFAKIDFSRFPDGLHAPLQETAEPAAEVFYPFLADPGQRETVLAQTFRTVHADVVEFCRLMREGTAE